MYMFLLLSFCPRGEQRTSFSFHSFPDWPLVLIDFPACLLLLECLSGAASWEQKAQLEESEGSCGKQQAVAKEGWRERICSTSLFLPCRVQWHVISTGWEPMLSSSPLYPTLNISQRLCFIQGLAECRGEKNLRRCLARGLSAALAQSVGILG